MNKYVNVKQIVDEMELKEGLCFTAVERTYLEIAVLKGAMAMLDYEREKIKKLQKLEIEFNKYKNNWLIKLIKRNKK